MTRTRRREASAVIVGNRVYIFGGISDNEDNGIIQSVETNRVSNGWVEYKDGYIIPDMPQPLTDLSAVLVLPEKIMVVGGGFQNMDTGFSSSRQVFYLHLDERVWTRGPPLSVSCRSESSNY